MLPCRVCSGRNTFDTFEVGHQHDSGFPFVSIFGIL